MPYSIIMKQYLPCYSTIFYLMSDRIRFFKTSSGDVQTTKKYYKKKNNKLYQTSEKLIGNYQ